MYFSHNHTVTWKQGILHLWNFSDKTYAWNSNPLLRKQELNHYTTASPYKVSQIFTIQMDPKASHPPDGFDSQQSPPWIHYQQSIYCYKLT